MKKINNGGPAFPMAKVTVLAEDGTPNEACAIMHDGMTLRDYFAAHAPEPPPWWNGGERGIHNIIQWRLAYADAMIAAREAK